MHRALGSPKAHGHIKVACYGFIYLLARSGEDGASYRPNFFAGELVGCDGGAAAGGSSAKGGKEAGKEVKPIIPVLLVHPRYELKTLGTELLAAFVAQQVRQAAVAGGGRLGSNNVGATRYWAGLLHSLQAQGTS